MGEDRLRANRWERLRDLPPADEAMLHYESGDDPLDAAELICDGCKDDWPCDFERGRRSRAGELALDVERLARAIAQFNADNPFLDEGQERHVQFARSASLEGKTWTR